MPIYPKTLIISDPIQEAMLKKTLTAAIMAGQIEKRIADSTGIVPFISPNANIQAAQDLLMQLEGEDVTGEIQWNPDDLHQFDS